MRTVFPSSVRKIPFFHHAKSRRALMLLAGAVVPFVVGPVNAQVWTNPAGGDFNTGSNWSTGTVPGPSAFGTFEGDVLVNPASAVTMSMDTTTNGMTLKNTTGTITFDLGVGRVYTHNLFTIMGDGALPAVQRPSAILKSGEIHENSLLLVGNNDHTEAHITVDGPNSIWSATGAWRIGSDSGSNSTALVTNGGRLTSAGDAWIGLQSAHNCDLTVTGLGSQASARNTLQMGGDNTTAAGSGSNTLNVTNGGQVTLGRVLMGVGNTGSTGFAAGNNSILVSGANSKLTLSGTLSGGATSTAGFVGLNFGGNSITTEDGGELLLPRGDLRVGSGAASLNNLVRIKTGGSMTLNGAGTLGTGSLEAGQGRLDNRRGTFWMDGGNATIPGIMSNTAPTSLLRLDGGVLAVGNASINTGGVVNLGDGTGATCTYRMMNLASGVHSFANGLSLQSDGRLEGNGTIAGNVSGVSGAQVSPGLSPGTINVLGNWDNTGIEVTIEVGNVAANGVAAIDLLNVIGDFTQGGKFTIDTTNFVPLPGPVGFSQKVIGWTNSIGPTGNTTVMSSLPYEFRSDGFYVLVPEPASLAAVAALAALFRRRRA